MQVGGLHPTFDIGRNEAPLLHQLGDQRTTRRVALAVVVGEVFERRDAVMASGPDEQFLAGLVLGWRGHRQVLGRDHPLGQVIDPGEIVRAAVPGEATLVEERLERDLAVVVVPPRSLGPLSLPEVTRDNRPVGFDVSQDLFDVVGAVGHQPPKCTPPVRRRHPPAVQVMVGGRYVRGLVDPVLEQLAGPGGIVDQRPRVGTEAGEQRKLLAAHQHVDGVDLDDPHPIDDAAQMATIDAPGRPRIVESLGAERDPTRLRVRELHRRRHGRDRTGCAEARFSRRRR